MYKNADTWSVHYSAQKMTNMGLWHTHNNITDIKATPVATVPVLIACLACRSRILFAVTKAMRIACVEHPLNIYFVGFVLKNKTNE